MAQGDKQKVVISGVGIISALGIGIDTLWEAMCEGRTGIKRIERFDPSGFASQVAGELEGDAFKVRKIVPKSHRKATKVMCRDTELAVGAAAACVEDAGIQTAANNSEDTPTLNPDRVGCHIGAGLISAELNELAAALVTSKQDDGTFDLAHWGSEGMQNLTPLWLLKYLPNMLACHVTIVHDLRGPSNTITCCEASSGLSIAESRRVIQRGDADACLSGGAEDHVNPLALYRQHCTNRLVTTDGSSTLVSPFAKDAEGTVVGEGGGILLIESETSCKQRVGNIWCSIEGIGCKQATGECPLKPDAHAVTSAIQKALNEAGCDESAIDVIVPLGSGVKELDNVEAEALSNIFGDQLLSIPTITTIPFTGNCMAGNGAIAVGVAAKALKEQHIPARLGASETMSVQAQACESNDAQLEYALVVSPSEGGQCVAIVLKRGEA